MSGTVADGQPGTTAPVDLGDPLDEGTQPPGDDRRPPRVRPLWRSTPALVVLTTISLAVAVSATVILRSGAQAEALGAGVWSAQSVAGGTQVRDANGVVWAAATGLRGGADQDRSSTAAAGTGSPQLYRTARVGATSWTVRVPKPSRYALDLLVAPPASGSQPGQNVFDVSVRLGDGEAAVLRRGVDPATWAAGQPQHVTGMVLVTGKSLTLTLKPQRGATAVSGLAVTSAPSRKSQTLMDDTFDGAAGSAPPAHWKHVTGSGPFGGTELQGYTDSRDHSRLDGKGHLELVATKEPYQDQYGTRPYTSARLNTLGTVAIRYGRIEATVLSPAGKGMWPAVWAIGTNEKQIGWPRAGEIDVMEELGAKPSMVAGHVHALGDAGDPVGDSGEPVSSYGVEHESGIDLTRTMHTVSVDIQPGAITFSLNGKPYYVATREDLRTGQQWPVGHPYYLIVNLAVGGWYGPPDGSTPFPGRLLIDRIRLKGWS